MYNQALSGWHRSLSPFPPLYQPPPTPAARAVGSHDFIILLPVSGRLPTLPQTQPHKQSDEKCSVVSLEFLSGTLWLPAWQLSGVSDSSFVPGRWVRGGGAEPVPPTDLAGLPSATFHREAGEGKPKLCAGPGERIIMHTSMHCFEDKTGNCM